MAYINRLNYNNKNIVFYNQFRFISFGKTFDNKKKKIEAKKLVVDYIKKGNPKNIDLNLMKGVLSYSIEKEKIKQIHIDLCKEIIKNQIVLDLPLFRSDKATAFSKSESV